MKQLENYHYGAYLFALAAISDKVEISRKIEGTGLARKVYYTISSPDKKYNETFSFFSMPKSSNPFKRELFDLVSHICKTKKLNMPENIENDSEMMRRLLYLFNEAIHMKNVKLSFCFSQEEFDKKMDEIASPFETLADWRVETEKNFIPMCREHMLLKTAENLSAEILSKPQMVNESQIINSISSTLKIFGFNEAYISNMINTSASLPPDGNQMQ